MPQFSSTAMTLKMLNAHKNLRQKRSLWYCNDHFGHYGLFATLPLHTAVITTDDFEFSAFLSAFARSGENHHRHPPLNSQISRESRDDAVDNSDEIATCLEQSYGSFLISDIHILLFLPPQDSNGFRALAKRDTHILLVAYHSVGGQSRDLGWSSFLPRLKHRHLLPPMMACLTYQSR
jgi:hypothetical protein